MAFNGDDAPSGDDPWLVALDGAEADYSRQVGGAAPAEGEDWLLGAWTPAGAELDGDRAASGPESREPAAAEQKPAAAASPTPPASTAPPPARPVALQPAPAPEHPGPGVRSQRSSRGRAAPGPLNDPLDALHRRIGETDRRTEQAMHRVALLAGRVDHLAAAADIDRRFEPI